MDPNRTVNTIHLDSILSSPKYVCTNNTYVGNKKLWWHPF